MHTSGETSYSSNLPGAQVAALEALRRRAAAQGGSAPAEREARALAAVLADLLVADEKRGRGGLGIHTRAPRKHSETPSTHPEVFE